jgi:hypothetical protein
VSKINEILNEFERITLKDLNSIKLMDRTDKKFVLSIKDLPVFLKQLSKNYNVLAIDNKLNFSYKTVYYDTVDFAMYLKHHNGFLNRYKIRQRSYLDNGKVFLEVKLKNNKGRTIKDRTAKINTQTSFLENEIDFIASNTPYKAEELFPKVIVGYSRYTFVNKISNEKITVDTDLTFSNSKENFEIKNLVIVEVKQGTKVKSLALSVLKDIKIKPMSISKYCVAVNYLYPTLKNNNFKEKLVSLNKIINGTSFDHIAGI